MYDLRFQDLSDTCDGRLGHGAVVVKCSMVLLLLSSWLHTLVIQGFGQHKGFLALLVSLVQSMPRLH